MMVKPADDEEPADDDDDFDDFERADGDICWP